LGLKKYRDAADIRCIDMLHALSLILLALLVLAALDGLAAVSRPVLVMLAKRT
jgi:hypothetical protein